MNLPLLMTSAMLTIAVLLALPASALAQGTAQQRSDCMGDAFRFCASDIPNVSKIEACLQKNVAQLTPGCASEFTPKGKTRMKRNHFATR